MTRIAIALFLLTSLFGTNYGDWFLFMPERMLPPIGTTFNFTFQGQFADWKIEGVYTVQPVVDESTKTIIGYRNWQLYSGDFTGIFYGVSYKNSTYPQATINSQTQECENVFSETTNCTTWMNRNITRWDSRCFIARTSSPITGEMAMTIYSSTTDLNRFSETYITGSPTNISLNYRFLSQTIQTNFPYVKCDF